MKAQSVDTSLETERTLVTMLRKAPVWQRFRLVQSLSHSVLWSQVQLWQERHPGVSEQEAAIQIISQTVEPTLVACVQSALEKRQDWHLQSSDLLSIMLPLTRLCEDLRIPYYLGGSIASSVYGMQQLAQDIDLVVDLPEHLLPALLAVSTQGYVFHAPAIQRAVQLRTAFSVIHLNSLMKIDVVMSKQSTFDGAMQPLVTRQLLDEHFPLLSLASPTEMILFKLQRYHQCALSRPNVLHDDAEWNDILGMLKVQGANLAFTLLAQWAITLDIADIWQQALVDAGLKDA